MAHLHDLVEEASTITSSTTGGDYNYDGDHKDDDVRPSILVLDPQEFFQPPSNSIAVFVTNDKAKAGCGQDVAISATGHQFLHTVVSEGQVPIA